ncbi:hypothetical protein E2C01_094372 [Portunus trituberculatus]|uniref:Uncharacterized protein n=1 Tax=Portunus trituberculatus TaxID=210409 RepID=A0A5B7JQ93_PORTR|nr:hypothetical protein [Portunus trituberculatus]
MPRMKWQESMCSGRGNRLTGWLMDKHHQGAFRSFSLHHHHHHHHHQDHQSFYLFHHKILPRH